MDTDQTPEEIRTTVHKLHFQTDGLDAFLEQLAILAANTVVGDTTCGITVIRDVHPTTVATSDERAGTFDEFQYADGDGPCLQAARTGEVVVVDDLATDERWPRYRDRSVAQGLCSSLSIPLTLEEGTVGALNLYVLESHPFGEEEQATLGQFCDETSRAISLALRHDALTQQQDHLHMAMASRRVIDQALGIIMAQNRCSAEEAFAILRRASNNRNVKINALATDMIRTMSGAEPDHDNHWTN
jgi:GAF domain-containing protein